LFFFLFIWFWWRQLAPGRSLKFASCPGGWGERSCLRSATAIHSVVADHFWFRGPLSILSIVHLSKCACFFATGTETLQSWKCVKHVFKVCTHVQLAIKNRNTEITNCRIEVTRPIKQLEILLQKHIFNNDSAVSHKSFSGIHGY